MEKKYKYNIGVSAEGYTVGTIELTKNEASIVSYALNQGNWQITHEESFSGDAWIDIEHPMEI